MTSTSHRPPGERRRHERRAVSVPARLTLVGYTVEGRLANVGAGGVCFTTDDPHLQVEAGNFVQVAFDCEQAGTPLTIERAVRVSWVQAPEDDEEGPRSLGLAFDEPLDLAGLTFGG